MGHSALCLLKILYGDPRPGVADSYSISRPYRDLRGRNFPAVRDGESADTVVIDGDMLGGNTVLLFSVVHVDMVDQLRHHALGDLGGVGVPPDSCKKRVNVHPLSLALFQLQPQRLDPLGVLLVPLGHLRKPGVADFLAHIVLVKPLEKPVKLFIPRQKPIQLPLFPSPLVLRHFRGWEIVRKSREHRRRPTKMGEIGLFFGLAYCADCGVKLYHHRSITLTKEQESYICSNYQSRKKCTAHYIRAVVLEQLVLQNLQRVVAYAQEDEKEFVRCVMENKTAVQKAEQEQARRKLEKQERRISELARVIQQLYEDRVAGALSAERFAKLSEGTRKNRRL